MDLAGDAVAADEDVGEALVVLCGSAGASGRARTIFGKPVFFLT